MPRFRKRPVVVEAMQWTGNNHSEIAEFVTGSPYHEMGTVGDDLLIHTLEDGPAGEAKHYASLGDWIIRGASDVFYLCKPDIFALTYESADGDAPGVAWALYTTSASGREE